MPAFNAPLNAGPGTNAVSGPVAFPLPDSKGISGTGATQQGVPGALMGLAVAEAAGAAASFRLYDVAPNITTVAAAKAAVAAGTAFVLMPLFTLAANQSIREWPNDAGLEIVNGAVLLEVVAGALEGNLYWSK